MYPLYPLRIYNPLATWRQPANYSSEVTSTLSSHILRCLTSGTTITCSASSSLGGPMFRQQGAQSRQGLSPSRTSPTTVNTAGTFAHALQTSPRAGVTCTVRGYPNRGSWGCANLRGAQPRSYDHDHDLNMMAASGINAPDLIDDNKVLAIPPMEHPIWLIDPESERRKGRLAQRRRRLCDLLSLFVPQAL